MKSALLFSWLIASCVTLLSNAQSNNNPPTPDDGGGEDTTAIIIIIVVLFVVIGIPICIIIFCCACTSMGYRSWGEDPPYGADPYVHRQFNRVEDPQPAPVPEAQPWANNIAQPERMLCDEGQVGLDHDAQLNIIQRMSQNAMTVE